LGSGGFLRRRKRKKIKIVVLYNAIVAFEFLSSCQEIISDLIFILICTKHSAVGR